MFTIPYSLLITSSQLWNILSVPRVEENVPETLLLLIKLEFKIKDGGVGSV